MSEKRHSSLELVVETPLPPPPGTTREILDTVVELNQSTPHSDLPPCTPSVDPTSPADSAQSTAPTNESSTSLAGHPLGVQPQGNKYFSTIPSIRESGLGMFHRLDDDALASGILSYLDGLDLLRLSAVNKAWYALIVGLDVDIWRDRVIELTGGHFIFQWTWRLTWIVEYQLRNPIKTPTIPEEFVNMYGLSDEEYDILVKRCNEGIIIPEPDSIPSPTTETSIPPPTADTATTTTTTTTPPIYYASTFPHQLLSLYPTLDSARPVVNCSGYYSDAIFQPWFWIDSFDVFKDQWGAIERNIERIHVNDMTLERFQNEYECPGKPVVITGCVESWPCYKDKKWSELSLLTSRYSHISIKYACGVGNLTMDKYLIYLHRCWYDDTPLYLFDKQFGEKNPLILDDYTTPEYFSQDYYKYLTKHALPPFRWWLVGPARSGSSYHKDNLYTHAFNALISGKKKWIFYPPHITPPGVMSSQDHLQVTAPLSLSEWYINFYNETKPKRGERLNWPAATPSVSADISQQTAKPIVYDYVRDFPKKCTEYSQYQPIEVIQNPGDIIFVPSQWWHTAVNLEPSIAITQNHLNSSNLLDGMNLLTKIGQPGLRDDLKDGVEAHHPGLIDSLRLQRDQERKKIEQTRGYEVNVKKELSSIFIDKPRLDVSNNDNDQNSTISAVESFSFDF